MSCGVRIITHEKQLRLRCLWRLGFESAFRRSWSCFLLKGMHRKGERREAVEAKEDGWAGCLAMEGRTNHPQEHWVHLDLEARARSRRQARLCAGAQDVDVRQVGQTTGRMGARSPHQRSSRRQPNRESSTDKQVGTSDASQGQGRRARELPAWVGKDRTWLHRMRDHVRSPLLPKDVQEMPSPLEGPREPGESKGIWMTVSSGCPSWSRSERRHLFRY